MRRKKIVCAKTDDKKKYLIPFGDWHLGAKNCDVDSIRDMVKWIKKKNAWVVGMGDLFENASLSAPHGAVYDQEINTEEQKEEIYSLLKPITNNILGLLTGNHEWRNYKDSGDDLTKDLCRWLDVPYLGPSAFLKLKVGEQNYKGFVTHGSTGSKNFGTKIKKCMDLSNTFQAQFYCMGHVHELGSHSKERRSIQGNQIKKEKVYFILTGHFLDYDDSYAERSGYEPGKKGVARIRLNGEKHDIHVST